jgi:hypothetical protein
MELNFGVRKNITKKTYKFFLQACKVKNDANKIYLLKPKITGNAKGFIFNIFW